MAGNMARVRIDELLEKRGITAYRLAIDAKVHHSTIAKLRHGKASEIRFDVIDRLCEVLDCDAGELIQVERSKKGKSK